MEPKGIFSTIFILLFSFTNLIELKAEGTKELMPDPNQANCMSYIQGNDTGGGGNKQGPTYDEGDSYYIYAHISDPLTETIYYGFTRKEPLAQSIYYKIVDPNGTVVCTGKVAETAADPGYIADDGVAAYVGPTQLTGAASGGYTAMSCTPTVAGEYAIMFNVGDPVNRANTTTRYYVHPFDVTVADISTPATPQAIGGRLFSYRWTLNTTGSTREACMSFFTWVPADSIVVEMDMNGMQAFGYTVAFNSFGTENTGDLDADRQSKNGITGSDDSEYRVFLNDPDPVVWPSGTVGSLDILGFNGCPSEGDYCILASVDHVGQIDIFIDLNNNGVYDANTSDLLYSYYTTEIGEICIPWDGKDGLGNSVTSGIQGKSYLKYVAGVLHFPVWDAEGNANGFSANVVRPAGLAAPLLYWDNSDVPVLGNKNLLGCSTGCNTWPLSIGDQTLVNTWVGSIASEDEVTFTIVTDCPPRPAVDNTCALPDPNQGIIINVLDNDADPDGNIDPSSLSIMGLNSAEGVATVNPVNGTILFAPKSGFTGVTTFQYEVCDLTSGGGLCSPATVNVEVLPTCTNAATFPVEYLNMDIRQVGEQVQLDWVTAAELNSDFFVVERSLTQDAFVPVSSPIQAAGNSQTSKSYSFSDSIQTVTSKQTWYYRIRQVDLDGTEHLSKILSVNIDPTKNIWARVYPNPNAGTFTLHLTHDTKSEFNIRLLSLDGRIVWNHSSWQTKEYQETIHLPNLTAGLYILQVLDDHSSKEVKIQVQ